MRGAIIIDGRFFQFLNGLCNDQPRVADCGFELLANQRPWGILGDVAIGAEFDRAHRVLMIIAARDDKNLKMRLQLKKTRDGLNPVVIGILRIWPEILVENHRLNGGFRQNAQSGRDALAINNAIGFGLLIQFQEQAGAVAHLCAVIHDQDGDSRSAVSRRRVKALEFGI